MRRDAIFQPQERPQPVDPLVAEAFDVRPAIRPSERAAERDDDQVEQFVSAGSLDARIGKIFKRGENGDQSLRHRKTLREREMPSRRNQNKALVRFKRLAILARIEMRLP